MGKTKIMRTPTHTAAELELQLGPRGQLNVNSENRPLVRKWVTAQGFPAAFVAGLSMREMGIAYNQVDGSGLNALTKKYNESKDEIDAEAAAETPVPAPAPAPVHVPGRDQTRDPSRDPAAILREILLHGWEPGLNEARVLELIEQHSKAPRPHQIEIKRPDAAPIVIEGRAHPEFERCLKYLTAIGPNGYQVNVLLVGPAGCGKTYLAAQLAKAMGRDLTVVSGSAGVSEGAINGYLLPGEGGAFEYVPSDFVKKYEGGNALICFDEFDAFDPNMLLAANMATANGEMYIPIRRDNPRVKRGKDVSFIANANTFGTGANPLYTARAAMDAATLDRYVTISVDYDQVLEEQIGLAGGLTAGEMAGIWELREKTREASLRRVIGTRAFQKAAVLKQCGETWREIRARLLEGWTADEKAKVGA